MKDFKPDPLLPGNDASASKGKSKGEKKMQDEIAAKVNAVVTGSTANISAKGNSADKKKDVDRKPGAGNELSPNANGDGDEPGLGFCFELIQATVFLLVVSQSVAIALLAAVIACAPFVGMCMGGRPLIPLGGRPLIPRPPPGKPAPQSWEPDIARDDGS